MIFSQQESKSKLSKQNKNLSKENFIGDGEVKYSNNDSGEN